MRGCEHTNTGWYTHGKRHLVVVYPYFLDLWQMFTQPDARFKMPCAQIDPFQRLPIRRPRRSIRKNFDQLVAGDAEGRCAVVL